MVQCLTEDSRIIRSNTSTTTAVHNLSVGKCLSKHPAGNSCGMILVAESRVDQFSRLASS